MNISIWFSRCHSPHAQFQAIRLVKYRHSKMHSTSESCPQHTRELWATCSSLLRDFGYSQENMGKITVFATHFFSVQHPQASWHRQAYAISLQPMLVWNFVNYDVNNKEGTPCAVSAIKREHQSMRRRQNFMPDPQCRWQNHSEWETWPYISPCACTQDVQRHWSWWFWAIKEPSQPVDLWFLQENAVLG